MGTNTLKEKIVLFIMIIPFLTWRCESNDRFYRPNLPEKLCSIAIIDADDTTHYRSPIPDLLDSTNTSRRYISFEKSYQIEYPEERNDSLRVFSFSISSSDNELFSYHSDSSSKYLRNLRIPDSILFKPGEKYYLTAKEKDCPEISAEIIAPEPPSELKLVSVNKETTEISQNKDCPILNSKIVHATIEISFFSDNKQKLYYALLLEGRGANINLPPYLSGIMDFYYKRK